MNVFLMARLNSMMEIRGSRPLLQSHILLTVFLTKRAKQRFHKHFFSYPHMLWITL